MEISLTGKTALITGGSKGLGLAMAMRLAASGADVAIVARGRDALAGAEKAIGATARGRVVSAVADVAKADDIKRAHGEIMRALGRIDILINNAGTSQRGAFEEITDEVWQNDLDLKLFGAIRLTRLVLPGMRERKWGRIINVLNIGAKAPRAASAPTSVTRAAGMALTKVLAGEGAPHNVLVNALLVGTIESDQWQRRADQQKISLQEYLKPAGQEVPLGRVGRAEEFANIACFLASDASSYITGTAINVDGGRSPVV
jgi:NAD(P)-dependent dehydrogenase (short-subunit alcohol dehydrogenase family)